MVIKHHRWKTTLLKMVLRCISHNLSLKLHEFILKISCQIKFYQMFNRRISVCFNISHFWNVQCYLSEALKKFFYTNQSLFSWSQFLTHKRWYNRYFQVSVRLFLIQKNYPLLLLSVPNLRNMTFKCKTVGCMCMY